MNAVVFPTREQIDKLEEEAGKLPQLDIDNHTHHFFSDGMYMRTAWRPADTLVIGRVHKKEHFFILAEGEMTMMTEQGMQRIKAPYFCVSKPGTKRVNYSHTAATVITIHRTEFTDLIDVENDIAEFDPLAKFGVGNVLLNKLLKAEL